MVFGSKGMNKIGNTDFFSDGSSQIHIGNSIFNSNGSGSHMIGNNLFTPNGAVNKIGNTFYAPDGGWNMIAYQLNVKFYSQLQIVKECSYKNLII